MLRSWLLPFLLVLVPPAVALAQPEHLPEYLSDSPEVFVVRIHADTSRQVPIAPRCEYVLVWTDHCDGGPSWITRGGGTVTLASFNFSGKPEGGVVFSRGGVPSDAIFFGDHYALIDVEMPTALVRYTRWHIEQRVP